MSVELGRIYAGVKEKVEADVPKHRNQFIELENFGNIPAKYKWD